MEKELKFKKVQSFPIHRATYLQLGRLRKSVFVLHPSIPELSDGIAGDGERPSSDSLLGREAVAGAASNVDGIGACGVGFSISAISFPSSSLSAIPVARIEGTHSPYTPISAAQYAHSQTLHSPPPQTRKLTNQESQKRKRWKTKVKVIALELPHSFFD